MEKFSFSEVVISISIGISFILMVYFLFGSNPKTPYTYCDGKYMSSYNIPYKEYVDYCLSHK